MKILALGAHPDDIELGCGGSVHHLIKAGNEVTARIFTNCQNSCPPDFSLEDEYFSAMKSLGVKDADLYHYENRFLEHSRQSILDRLYVLNHSYDLVLTGSSFNSHQDHLTVYNEAKKAFRGISIWGYALPNSDYGFSQNPIYSILSEEDVTAKIDALKEYKSQFALKRHYFDLDAIKSVVVSNGIEVGWQYAEKFEPIRIVMH